MTNETTPICTSCRSTDVFTGEDEILVPTDGGSVPVRMPYHGCNNCGREFVTLDQIKAGDEVVRELKGKSNNPGNAKCLFHEEDKDACETYSGAPPCQEYPK